MTAVLTPADTSAKLLDVQAVAALLGCSPRTVYRLSDAGKMPSPVKLGALIRWNRAAVEEWIEAGCPSMRRASK
jgi:excisionase family DNA binding protein